MTDIEKLIIKTNGLIGTNTIYNNIPCEVMLSGLQNDINNKYSDVMRSNGIIDKSFERTVVELNMEVSELLTICKQNISLTSLGTNDLT